MSRELLVRASALYVPIVLTALVWLWRPPAPRERAAAFMATAWNIPALLALHVLATGAGWWTFDAQGGMLAGFPVDLYVGWALMWGALPVLVGRRIPTTGLVLVAVVLDLVAMPAMTPVVRLGGDWLVGEAVAVALCLVPAQLLASWTRDGVYPIRRASLLAIAFSALLLGVVPQVILEQTGGNWAGLTSRPQWVIAILLQCIAALGLLGVSAVQEFATRGSGTPVPFDPPTRLVTSGPYAYVRNPMQLSMVLVLPAWGALIGSWWVAAAGAMAAIYGAGFAAGDEHVDLERRFGAAWLRYASLVRPWIPRWRRADFGPDAQHATLYVAEECGPCSEVRAWFAVRAPVGLEIRAAERHPCRNLSRITYDPGDGTPECEGVAAVGRSLEHINLGWAMLAMFVRLPGIAQLLQLITDASGGGQRQVVRYCERPMDGV